MNSTFENWWNAFVAAVDVPLLALAANNVTNGDGNLAAWMNSNAWIAEALPLLVVFLLALIVAWILERL